MPLPLRLVGLTGLLALVLGACGANGGTSARQARQEAGAVATATPAPVGAVERDNQTTVRIHGLRLSLGDGPGADRVRVLLNNTAPNIRVTLSGNLDQELRSVTVCSVSGESDLPPSTQCVLPVSGRPVDLPAESTIKGVEISLAGRSTAVDVEEVAITFDAADRRVRFLLPDLDPATPDPACVPKGCPSFELTPARDGTISAAASWDGPGSGLIDVRTSVPPPTGTASPPPPAFRVVSSSTSASTAGPGEVAVSATVQSARRSILAFTNNGETPLRSPAVEVTWP